jgi:hypothetical protein
VLPRPEIDDPGQISQPHGLTQNPNGTIPVALDYLARVRSLAMAYRLARNRLYRRLAGAASALVICGLAVFVAARHFAI